MYWNFSLFQLCLHANRIKVFSSFTEQSSAQHPVGLPSASLIACWEGNINWPIFPSTCVQSAYGNTPFVYTSRFRQPSGKIMQFITVSRLTDMNPVRLILTQIMQNWFIIVIDNILHICYKIHDSNTRYAKHPLVKLNRWELVEIQLRTLSL